MKGLNTAKTAPARSNGRDAVETAIGLSKQDKSETWEGWISRNPNRILQWKEAITAPAEEKKSTPSVPQSTTKTCGQ